MRIIGAGRIGNLSFTVDIETEPGEDVIELFDEDGEPEGVLSFPNAAEADAAEALLCAEIGGNA